MKQGRKNRVMWYAVIFTLNAVIWLLTLLRFGIHGGALSLFTLSMFILLTIASAAWWLYWSGIQDDS